MTRRLIKAKGRIQGEKEKSSVKIAMSSEKDTNKKDSEKYEIRGYRSGAEEDKGQRDNFDFSMLTDVIWKLMYILTLPLQYIEPVLLPLLRDPKKIGTIMEVILCGKFFLACGIPYSLKTLIEEILLIFFLLIPLARSLYVFLQYIGIVIAKTISIAARYGTEWNYTIGRKKVIKNYYSEEEEAKARQIMQFFEEFRVSDLKKRRRELLDEINFDLNKENFSKTKEVNEAYGALFSYAISEKKHIELNQDMLLKFLYYITRPFIYIEQMVVPILDESEVILGSMNILIYAFCFSFFLSSVKSESDFGLAFFVIVFLMVPILKAVAAILVTIGTFILSIIAYICQYMSEFNIELEAKIFGSKGFDGDNYEDNWYHEDNQDHEQYRNERSKGDEERARKIFGLYGDFTVDELKTIRRNLIKENHPDMGGSEERAREINAAYDILLPMAKKSVST